MSKLTIEGAQRVANAIVEGNKVAAVKILKEETKVSAPVASMIISENMDHAIEHSGNYETCAKNFLYLYSPEAQVSQSEDLNLENVTNSEKTIQILSNHLGLVFDVLEPRAIHSIVVAFGEAFEEVYELGQYSDIKV